MAFPSYVPTAQQSKSQAASFYDGIPESIFAALENDANAVTIAVPSTFPSIVRQAARSRKVSPNELIHGDDPAPRRAAEHWARMKRGYQTCVRVPRS
ncbi:hypothetical protein BREVUG8_110716 [Brevundimonas sp. G8]|nr:hypothetical protein BREVUG8_110716 [Brevundimonas sp. G8]